MAGLVGPEAREKVGWDLVAEQALVPVREQALATAAMAFRWMGQALLAARAQAEPAWPAQELELAVLVPVRAAVEVLELA